MVESESAIRKHPVLSQFCDPLPRLMDPGTQDVARSVNHFGELLGDRKRSISIGFQIIGDERERYWRLQVGPQGSGVAEEAVETEKELQPDMEIIATEEVWRRLTAGVISPLTAMCEGLRYRGDVRLASNVIQQLRRAAEAQLKERG